MASVIYMQSQRRFTGLLRCWFIIMIKEPSLSIKLHRFHSDLHRGLESFSPTLYAVGLTKSPSIKPTKVPGFHGVLLLGNLAPHNAQAVPSWFAS
jgi:hypothetical protein